MRTTMLGLVCLGMTACATLPTAPSVMVWPSPGKPLEVFQAEDQFCRQYARGGLGTTQDGAMMESGVTSAALGTVVGTAAGALIGAVTGSAGMGAAIGAGSGLVLGSSVGVGASQATGATVQQRYDQAFLQCMYTKGNQAK
jgi:hypothetical protein